MISRSPVDLIRGQGLSQTCLTLAQVKVFALCKPTKTAEHDDRHGIVEVRLFLEMHTLAEHSYYSTYQQQCFEDIHSIRSQQIAAAKLLKWKSKLE